MSSEISITNLIVIVEITICVIVLLYSAYVSFVVRRGLVVPLYRSRALWLGILAILTAVTFVATILVGVISTVIYIYLVTFVLAFVVLFLWIDRTIDTLIRLDYQRRDIIGWKKARFLYWLCVALWFCFYLITTGYTLFGIVNSITTFFASVNGTPIFLIALAYASAVLVTGSIRTRDLTFRNHAKWLGLAVVGLLVLFLPISNIPPILDTIPEIFIAYCLYRMARSLVPVNKLKVRQTLAE